MEWTKEAPTEPGWYWAFNEDSNDPFVQIAQVTLYNGMYLVFTTYEDTDTKIEFDYFTHWLGPIPEPIQPVDMHVIISTT